MFFHAQQSKARLASAAFLTALGLAMAMAGEPVQALAQPPKGDGQPPKVNAGPPTAKPPGVSVNDSKAFKSYTLVAPMNSMKTHLIDMEGRVVRTWESDCTPALSAYLAWSSLVWPARTKSTCRRWGYA